MTFMMTFTIILGLTFTKCCLHPGVSVHFFIFLFAKYETFYSRGNNTRFNRKKELNGEVT